MIGQTDILEQAPAAAREEFAEVLAEISSILADPRREIEPYCQAVLYPRKAALWAKAIKLFTSHFLPLVVPGEWRFRRMDVGSWGEGFPRVWDHVRPFRRAGTRGRLTGGNSLVVTMPYLKPDAIAALHGRQAETWVGFPNQCFVTWAADCRLNSLSWHYPGRTALIVVAAPALLAAEHEVNHQEGI